MIQKIKVFFGFIILLAFILFIAGIEPVALLLSMFGK